MGIVLIPTQQLPVQCEDALGCYFPQEKRIYVDYSVSNKEKLETTYHEIGHALYLNNEEANQLADESFAGEDSLHVQKEIVAIKFAEFNLNPSKLKNEYPKLYDFFKKDLIF